jgi:hypothetical protein
MSKGARVSETQSAKSPLSCHGDYLKLGTDGTFTWLNQADGVFDASPEQEAPLSANERRA